MYLRRTVETAAVVVGSVGLVGVRAGQGWTGARGAVVVVEGTEGAPQMGLKAGMEETGLQAVSWVTGL